MAETTDDRLEGWKAARLRYQNTGGVQPYPPGYYEGGLTAEYVEGWQAARQQYQTTGGVQPYPPGHSG